MKHEEALVSEVEKKYWVPTSHKVEHGFIHTRWWVPKPIPLILLTFEFGGSWLLVFGHDLHILHSGCAPHVCLSSGGDEGETPLGTDEEQQQPRRPQPQGDPDSSGDGGGRDARGRKHVSMSINKWAKPIPKLELPPKVHLQKASKIKHIWELWSMNVALAMST